MERAASRKINDTMGTGRTAYQEFNKVMEVITSSWMDIYVNTLSTPI
jgi:hypothetical protein